MSALTDRAAVARALPFVVFMLLLGLRSLAPADGSWGFDPRWLYGATVIVVGALLLHFRRDYGELARQNLPTARETLLAVAVGVAVFVLWINLDAPWMTLDLGDAPRFVPLDAAGTPIWPLIALRWIGATLLVPVMEELFWRSFLMRWLQRPDFLALPPQAVGLRQAVVVHQPDQVRAALDRPGQTVVEALRPAAVGGEGPAEHRHGRPVPRRVTVRQAREPLPRAVGRRVVDDQHLGQPGDRLEALEEPTEQVQPVEGDDHRGHPRAGVRRDGLVGHGDHPRGTSLSRPCRGRPTRWRRTRCRVSRASRR